MEKRSVEELHDIYVQQRRLLEKLLLQQTAEPTMANPEGPAELPVSSSWLFNPNPHSSPSLLLNNFQQAAHASSMLPPPTSSSNSSNANSSSGLLTTQQVKFGPESHLFEQQFPYLHTTNNQTTSLNNLTTSSMTKSLLDASFLPNSSEAPSSAPTSSFSYQMQQHVPVHLNDHMFLHALNAFHPVMSMAPQQLQQSQFQLQNTPTTLSLSAGAPGGCSSLFLQSNFSYSSPFATFTPNSKTTQNAAAPARVLSFADSTSSPSVSSLPSVTVSSPERKSMGFPSGISIPDISSPELSPTTSSSGAPTPYKCRFPGCEKGFQDTTNTRRHEMTHVNFKPFWCPSCPQRFSRRSSLKSHMLSVHALPKSHPLIIQTLQQQTEKAALTTFGVMNFGEAKPQRRVPRARNRSGSRPVVGSSLSSIKSRSSSGRSTSASSASSVSPDRNALRITGVSLGTHKKEF